MIYVFTNHDDPIIAMLDGPDGIDMVKEQKAWRDKNYVLKLPPKPEIIPPSIITSKTQAAMLQPITDWQKECAALKVKLEASLAKEYGLADYCELDCFLVSLRRSKKYRDIPFKES